MEFAGLNPEMIAQVGFVGVVSYGLVGAVGLWKKDMTSREKFILLLAVAFGISFVPTSIGNVIADNFKIALAVATGMHTVNTVANKVGGN